MELFIIYLEVLDERDFLFQFTTHWKYFFSP